MAWVSGITRVSCADAPFASFLHIGFFWVMTCLPEHLVEQACSSSQGISLCAQLLAGEIQPLVPSSTTDLHGTVSIPPRLGTPMGSTCMQPSLVQDPQAVSAMVVPEAQWLCGAVDEAE